MHLGNNAVDGCVAATCATKNVFIVEPCIGGNVLADTDEDNDADWELDMSSCDKTDPELAQ